MNVSTHILLIIPINSHAICSWCHPWKYCWWCFCRARFNYNNGNASVLLLDPLNLLLSQEHHTPICDKAFAFVLQSAGMNNCFTHCFTWMHSVVKDLSEIRCICSIWKYFNENCSFEKSFNYLERLRGETHKAWRGTMEDICKAQICLRNAHTYRCYCPWLFLSIPWWDPCRWLSWW